MDKTTITTVGANTETICCDGGKDGLGHPAVYFTFNNQSKIICNYCERIFIKEKEQK